MTTTVPIIPNVITCHSKTQDTMETRILAGIKTTNLVRAIDTVPIAITVHVVVNMTILDTERSMGHRKASVTHTIVLLRMIAVEEIQNPEKGKVP